LQIEVNQVSNRSCSIHNSTSTKTKHIKKISKQDPDFLEATSSLNYITIDGQFLSNSISGNVHQSLTIDTLRFLVGLGLLQTASRLHIHTGP
jgi:hypothetical protein